MESTHKFALDQTWFHRMEPNHFIVIFAEKQTQGLGSHGRNWISTGNDFHINLVFLTDRIYPFTQLTSFSVCQHLSTITDHKFEFALKWPNDVYVRQKKISGCISYVRRWNEMYWATIGVGINYNLDAIYARTLDCPVTSLKLLQRSSKNYAVGDIFKSVQQFSECFVQNLCWYHQMGFHHFFKDCQHLWLYRQQPIRIFDEDQGRWIQGIFESLTPEGSLQVRLADQSLHRALNGTQLHPITPQELEDNKLPRDTARGRGNH